MHLLLGRQDDELLDILECEIIDDFEYFILYFHYNNFKETPLLLYSTSFQELFYSFFSDSFQLCIKYIALVHYGEEWDFLEEDEQHAVEDLAHGIPNDEYSYDALFINTLLKNNIFHISFIDDSQENIGYPNYKITHSPLQEVW